MHTSPKQMRTAHCIYFNPTILDGKTALKVIPFLFHFSMTLNQIRTWLENETEANEQNHLRIPERKTPMQLRHYVILSNKSSPVCDPGQFMQGYKNVFVEILKNSHIYIIHLYVHHASGYLLACQYLDQNLTLR